MMSEGEEHGSLLEKINDKIHEFKKGSSSSSSSDSDDDKKHHHKSKSKKKRLFGRTNPLHHVLGGGKGTYIYISSLKMLVSLLIRNPIG
jgi:hypothetical protein